MLRVANIFASIFNGGTSYEGYCDGLIEINGAAKGVIRNGNSVLINPSGRFYGRIETKSLEIAGLVHGDVEAETLVIRSSGQLHYGTLSCKNLSVEDGSTLVNRGESESESVSEKPSCAAEQESPGVYSGGVPSSDNGWRSMDCKRPRFYSSY